jgi:predicted lipoprotein with Yx(FWY)xxD motif
VPVTINGEPIAPSFNVLTAGRQDVIINTSTDPSSQKYLVDNRRRALYISLEDSPGVSNCGRACQAQWRPLLATGRIVPGAGVARAKLGVLIHPDGSRQITYAGLPLYTYVNDTESGDTKGQGLDGLWFLVNP